MHLFPFLEKILVKFIYLKRINLLPTSARIVNRNQIKKEFKDKMISLSKTENDNLSMTQWVPLVEIMMWIS